MCYGHRMGLYLHSSPVRPGYSMILVSFPFIAIMYILH